MADDWVVKLQRARLDLVDNGWIHEVLTTPDTPLRTHRITLTYSIFAECLNELLFSAPTAVSNANWFHFATWGTYTLGPNIRNDSAPQRLESLPSAVRRWVTPAIIHNRSADGNLVGRALSWGQQLIFLSSAAALVRFRAPGMLDPGQQLDTPVAEKQQLLDAVNKSAATWIDMGHLELIDKAFSSYGVARRQAAKLRKLGKDPSADPLVCRLVLLGTILLTIVEQDLVTSALRTVTDAVPTHVQAQIDGRLSSYIAKRRGVPRQVVALDLLNQITESRTWLTEAWARFMTNQLMVIELPAETLRLGKDVPPRDYTAPLIAAPLDNLAADAGTLATLLESVDDLDADLAGQYLTDLDQVVRTLNRSADDGLGSGARDWRRFDDRLNWAICLFRSRQTDPSLFWPPYSEQDQKRIVHGELPHGRSLGGVIPPLDAGAVGKFLKVDSETTGQGS